MRNVEFAGRTAVVTGGASGIGKGMAEAFLARGANVVIADVDDDALQVTARQLGVLGVHTDVTDPDSVQALADRTVAEHGSVHALCSNAGVGPMAATGDLSLQDWQWIINVNLFGVIYGIHTFLPILERNDDWGHIVNTSSMSVLDPPANLAPYVASKAGVFGLTEVLDRELRQDNSNVGTTILIPGPVRTNISTSLRTRTQTEPSGLYDIDLARKRTNFRFIGPTEVGELVIGAIEANTLYTPTHAEWADPVTERHRGIQASFPAVGPDLSAASS